MINIIVKISLTDTNATRVMLWQIFPVIRLIVLHYDIVIGQSTYNHSNRY